ncbi:MAG: DUF3794 domain-containing protein [Clostridia bacterium]|nr:DUF3794 domain-containing protein [Clostridia bacterium]
MKPQIEKLPVCKRVFLGECRTVAEVQMVARENENIHVLSISADANILSCESLSGEVLFDGRLTAKAIIKDDDGNLASLSYNVDFADRLKNNGITADVKVQLDAVVENVDFNVQGNVIYAKCVVATSGCAFVCDEQDVVTDCDGLQTKKQTVATSKNVCFIKKDFSVVDEVELRQSVSKILLAQTNGVVSSVKCEQDVLSVKGDFFTCVTCVRDDGQICSVTIQTPFEEEFSAQNCNDDCIATCVVKTKNTKVRMEMQNDSTNEFSLEISAELCANVFDVQNADVVSDAFSKQFNIDLAEQKVQVCMPGKYVTHLCSADGVVDQKDVDEVLCLANAKAGIVSQVLAGGVLSLQGVVCADLLFVSEEKVVSSPLQIPFETKVQTGCNFVCEVSNVCVTQTSAKVVRGAVSVDFGLKFGINCFDCNKFAFVAGITMLDKKTDDDCAIEVFVGKKGMTSWDVQKRLGMGYDDLLACNPGLTLPLENDQKIVVYRKIE